MPVDAMACHHHVSPALDQTILMVGGCQVASMTAGSAQ
jgi:hypothetical protein